MTSDPKPKRIALFKRSEDCVVLAEDHGGSGYNGIEIDQADAGEVQRLLKITTVPHFQPQSSI